MKGYVIEEDGRWFVDRIPGRGDVFGKLKDAKLFATVGSAITYIKGMVQEDEYGNAIARYIYEAEVKRNENEDTTRIVRHISGSGDNGISSLY